MDLWTATFPPSEKDEISELMATHPSLSINEWGQIQCSLTGHCMPPRAESLRQYVGGRRYALASGQFQSIEDLVMELAPCPSLRKYHPQCYTFFRDLFQHHPAAERKRVAQIRDISLSGFRRPNGVPVFRIHFSKNESDTISWIACALNNGHLPSSSPSPL